MKDKKRRNTYEKVVIPLLLVLSALLAYLICSWAHIDPEMKKGRFTYVSNLTVMIWIILLFLIEFFRNWNSKKKGK